MMKLRPKSSELATNYPTALEYDRRMRQTLACLAMVGSGAMIGTAVADEPVKPKTEVKIDTAKSLEAAKKLALEEIRKEIEKCAADLGVDGFRKRREATRRLIAIGSVTEKSTAKVTSGRTPKSIMPYRDMVIAAMEKLDSHKDPEVKERAKLVVKALTPKPTPVRRGVRMGGAIAVEEW